MKLEILEGERVWEHGVAMINSMTNNCVWGPV